MFLTDALGSLVTTTDAAGGVQSELTYEPFGNTEMSSPSPAYRFTGREHDEPLYLYCYRARYYHTDLQRFISEDPVDFMGGDFNLYAYVRNIPTRFRDPSGLYLPYYHRKLTEQETGSCRFSKRDTKIIATANTRIDTRHPESWLSDTNPWHAMSGTDYQPIIDQQLERAINAPTWDEALTELGKGLHVVQDQWAHDKNSLGGDIHAHGKPWWEGNPDNPASNPENWAKAREATRQYLRDFMRGRGLKPRC